MKHIIFALLLIPATVALASPDSSLTNIQTAIGNGYTAYPALDARLKPGTIFTLKDDIYTVVSSNCIDATPTESPSASVNLRTKLSGGVSMTVMGKGAKTKIEEQIDLKFISPYVSGYESLDFRPSSKCKQQLQAWIAESYTPSLKIYIIQEALFAQVNGCTTISGEAGVNMTNRLSASGSITKACERFSGSNYVMVGYKSEALGTFLAKEPSSNDTHETSEKSTESVQIESGDLGSLLRSLEAQAQQQAELEHRVQDKIDEESAPILAKAQEDWRQVRSYIERGDETGRRALEGFIEVYSEVFVVVGDKRVPIEIPQLAYAIEEHDNYTVQSDDIETTYETISVPSGTFSMGCSGGACPLDSQPGHTVTLNHNIKAMKTEVTQGLYTTITGKNPSINQGCGEACPVDNITWFDAIHFANALSKKEGLQICYQISGQSVKWQKGHECTGWRLPTEAEWEYMARASESHIYAGSDEAQAVAVTREMGSGESIPVGSLFPNGLGFMDLSGNVYEWCWDWSAQYTSSSQQDPVGPKTGSSKVIRGGSWGSPASAAMVYARGRNKPAEKGDMLGVRLVRTE